MEMTREHIWALWISVVALGVSALINYKEIKREKIALSLTIEASTVLSERIKRLEERAAE